MLSDVFDSVNFAHDNEQKKINKIHASFALKEGLIWHEEGLALTFPQLIDGYFAQKDCGEQNLLWEMLNKGYLKIAYWGKNFIEYLEYIKYSLTQKGGNGFKFSSMPLLMEQLKNSNKDALEFLLEVLNCLTNRTPIETISIYSNMPYRAELKYFNNYISSFLKIENEHHGLYIESFNDNLLFNEFLNNMLGNVRNDDLRGIFQLDHLNVTTNEFKEFFFATQNRTELYDYINKRARNQQKSEILSVVDVIYNMYTLRVYNDMEVHIPCFADERGEALKNIIINQLVTPRMIYQNTETILENSKLVNGALTLDDAIRLRGEISEKCKKDGMEWKDALKEIMSRDDRVVVNEGQYAMKIGGFTFVSNDDWSARLQDFDSVVRLKHDSYVRKSN